MSGEFDEKTIGDKATVSIGGSVFNMKINFDLDDGSPAERSANSGGFDYAFGAQDGTFTCDIETTTPEISTIRGWRVRDANGDITAQATVITLPAVSDITKPNTVGTFNAKYHRYRILNTSPDGFVLVRLFAVITSDNVSWT